MSTNANVFNSRVTSEALEAKFRQVFPAQAGAELIQDLYASGVIQPVIDFSSVAEGSVLPAYLQQAWDFSTQNYSVSNTTTTIVSNTGFWKCDLTAILRISDGVGATGVIEVFIDDGSSTKPVWSIGQATAAAVQDSTTQDSFVVFLRAGDSLKAQTNDPNQRINIWTRQIADVNGTLVNPLGFTFS